MARRPGDGWALLARRANLHRDRDGSHLQAPVRAVGLRGGEPPAQGHSQRAARAVLLKPGSSRWSHVPGRRQGRSVSRAGQWPRAEAAALRPVPGGLGGTHGGWAPSSAGPQAPTSPHLPRGRRPDRVAGVLRPPPEPQGVPAWRSATALPSPRNSPHPGPVSTPPLPLAAAASSGRASASHTPPGKGRGHRAPSPARPRPHLSRDPGVPAGPPRQDGDRAQLGAGAWR